jgi:DNA-binding transcriptional regulator PaaX
LVLFDIPEKDRTFRDILREHLKELKFRKLQQSVFVSPHPFEQPILELISLYEAQPHVRVVSAERIDNEDQLRKIFFKNKM